MSLSRRDFLKACGAGAAMLGVGAKFPDATVERRLTVPPDPKQVMGVLIDTTMCVGCRTCQKTCKAVNGLPADDVPATTLSAVTLTVIDMHNISPNPAQPVLKPVKLQCMHCQDPACVSACPVGALYKKENGCVAYDVDKCIGCRYCMTACPYGIPKYDWNSPSPKINKCVQGCMSRGDLAQPSCVQACPAKALTYGNREQLLTMARDRIAKNPAKYVNYVYGEREGGGTSFLYLSGVPFEQLGFRTDMLEKPLPQYTLDVMERVPWLLGAVFVGLSSIAWWTHRDERKPEPAPIANVKK